MVKLSKKLNCGDCCFELYFYYKDRKRLEAVTSKKVSKTEENEIKEILNYYSGIKLYRDNFRIKPYGDSNNDWIKLDAAAQNSTILPRNNAIIGIVHISKSKNSKIVDTTTREGIIYTDEFQDLIDFVKTSIMKIFVDLRSEFESNKVKARKKNIKKNKQIKVISIAKQLAKNNDEILLDIKKDYPQSFYYNLQDEINFCYFANRPNAVFFLSRKLIENLVFNILEKKFSSNVSMWYDQKFKVHLKFYLLIKNLYDNKDKFKPNAEKYITKFNTDVVLFRREANEKAHNIFDYLTDKKELKRFKIEDLVQLLINIYNSI